MYADLKRHVESETQSDAARNALAQLGKALSQVHEAIDQVSLLSDNDYLRQWTKGLVAKLDKKQMSRWDYYASLFDDASCRKKFEVMSKWEVMLDDSRNVEPDIDGELDDILQFGRKYRVTMIVEDIGEAEPVTH